MNKHLVPVLGGLGLLLVAGAHPAQAAGGQDGPLNAVRAMTAKYQDESRAIADGFQRTDTCVAVAGLGGMGYHYIHHKRIDRRLVPGKPEVLVYATIEGERRLVAVEYLVVDRDQDLTTDDDRPVLRGHPLEGPMPGHEPGMPVHYDLHVWAHVDNPAGAWSTWNPEITCP